MGKLKLKELQEISNRSNFLVSFSGKNNSKVIEMKIIDIEKSLEEKRCIKLPRQLKCIPSMIQLPNNELFFIGSLFGSKSWISSKYDTNDENLAFIVDYLTGEINSIANIPQNFYDISGMIYWENSIYIYGSRSLEDIYSSLWSYSLNKHRLVRLATFPLKLFSSSCAYFEKKILIGFSYCDIYLYDLYTNSYSSHRIAPGFGTIILVSAQTNAYYIENRGYIYESGYKNPYVWNNIGISIWEDSLQKISWIYNNDFIFLRESKIWRDNIETDNAYFVLNLGKKTFKRKVLPKKDCYIF